MEFEWDEDKRRATIRKHGIDFVDAVEIFDGPVLHLPARSDIELRRAVAGVLHGTIIAVIYTMRGDRIRIITARRARRYEREYFRAFHAGTDPADERRN
ncbi:MAG: BrnT family toxin [Rubellimicrobium sp.]|nr:BrnT family toxin [Rubellimicrobium sp.]